MKPIVQILLLLLTNFNTNLAEELNVTLTQDVNGFNEINEASTVNVNGKKPFDAELMVSLNVVGSPLPSPDGKKLLYTQSEYFPSSNVRVTSVLLRDLITGQTKNMTNLAKTGVSNLNWLDNRNFAILSKKAIFTSNVDDVVPTVALNFTTTPIENFKLNVKGNRLVFGSYIDSPDPNTKFDSALVYDKLLVRHWDHFVARGIVQLFSVKINYTNNKLTALDTPINLLKGTELESPVDYSGSVDDYTISPDGNLVAFGAKKPGVDQAWETEQNIHLVTADGKSLQDLTLDNHGAATRPIFSPNGQYLSWLQMATPKYESDKNDIVLYNLKSGGKRILNKWDSSPGSTLFSRDSKKIFAIATQTGRNRLFSIDINSGKARTLTRDNAVGGFQILNEDKLVFTKSTFTTPNQIFTVDLSSRRIRQLTNSNQLKLKDVYLPKIEDFWFKGALNETVHGFIVKPINFSKHKKYPISLIIHGGPQSAYMDRWITNHNFNLHASAGRVAVVINYHGSTGYGQKFVDSINNEWGSHPYQDLLLGLDYVSKKFKWADRSSTCSVGTSFGGYMGNWINGHTDSFKCIVMGNGKLDTYNTYFTTDELWFPEYDFHGSAIENEASYRKWSPETYANNFKTPTLIIQGLKDYRIVDGEALALFTLLQRKGIKSKLLYFPDEGHGVSRPANVIEFSNQVVNWLKQF